MKIMVCGKGGCGKSTIASLLASEFVREGKKVLVVDTDESNYGLHRQLGAELPKDFTQFFGGKMAVLGNMMESNFECSFFDKRWTLADISAEYVSERDGIKLMAIGKIQEAGEGCACAMGAIAQQFISNLDLAPDEVLITDTEAGIEHFGRGVDNSADAILMIIDPSFESLKLSEKVSGLGDSIGKPVYYVLNRVDGEKECVMREALKNSDAIIAAIPARTEILSAGLKGAQLNCVIPEIKKITEFLNDRK